MSRCFSSSPIGTSSSQWGFPNRLPIRSSHNEPSGHWTPPDRWTEGPLPCFVGGSKAGWARGRTCWNSFAAIMQMFHVSWVFTLNLSGLLSTHWNNNPKQSTGSDDTCVETLSRAWNYGSNSFKHSNQNSIKFLFIELSLSAPCETVVWIFANAILPAHLRAFACCSASSSLIQRWG